MFWVVQGECIPKWDMPTGAGISVLIYAVVRRHTIMKKANKTISMVMANAFSPSAILDPVQYSVALIMPWFCRASN
jgi:hypothetical protein